MRCICLGLYFLWSLVIFHVISEFCLITFLTSFVHVMFYLKILTAHLREWMKMGKIDNCTLQPEWLLKHCCLCRLLCNAVLHIGKNICGNRFNLQKSHLCILLPDQMKMHFAIFMIDLFNTFYSYFWDYSVYYFIIVDIFHICLSSPKWNQLIELGCCSPYTTYSFCITVLFTNLKGVCCKNWWYHEISKQIYSIIPK